MLAGSVVPSDVLSGDVIVASHGASGFAATTIERINSDSSIASKGCPIRNFTYRRGPGILVDEDSSGPDSKLGGHEYRTQFIVAGLTREGQGHALGVRDVHFC